MEFPEKRQFPRVSIDYVTVEVYTSVMHTAAPEMSEICSVANISENGMLFQGENKYETGQLLRLTFLLPETIVIIRIDATVVHCDCERKRFNIGVQFRNMGIAERKLIRHFVDKALAGNQKPSRD